MKDKNTEANPSTVNHRNAPWHLWCMGLFFLFLYTIGTYDYFMMLGHNMNYYNAKHYGDAVVAYFTDYPLLFLAFWTLNIFSGLISPILLFLRSRWAAWCALISAVSIMCLEVLTFSFRNRWNVFGPWLSLFDISILLLTCGFFFYCKAMSKRDVLQ